MSRMASPSLLPEPCLEIGEDRVEPGAERDGEAVGPLAIALAADIGLPEAGEDAPEIGAVGADIAALAQIARPCAGVAVEAVQHVREVAVDVMVEPRGQRRPLLAGEA